MIITGTAMHEAIETLHAATCDDDKCRARHDQEQAVLTVVPIIADFVQIDVDGGEDWYQHCLRFLYERGYGLFGVRLDQLPTGPYIQTGVSPRGDGELRHAVIYKDGHLVHDPHPSGDGILMLESAYRIERIAQ